MIPRQLTTRRWPPPDSRAYDENAIRSRKGADMSTKEAALRLIERLPDDVSLEDIMYELYFRQRVDRGLQEIEEGASSRMKTSKRSLAQWLQSTGR